MKTHVKWLLAAVLAAGCGDPRPRNIGGVEGGPVSGAPEASPAGESVGVDLQLGAVGAERFSSLLVALDEVRVLADGAPVEVRPTRDLVDLADTARVETVATFALPPGVQRVEVHVGLGAAGGFATGKGSGWVDTWPGALRFEAAGTQLLRTRHSVVTIDVRRSFVERDQALVMVPTFRVH
ncbi:MAG TPA: hypothetical protein VFA20_27810 [Myxococcaceae bacterium]|nr:hypothetical protein [Myxococcaceae bacterium]